jgi:hypothetical protein
MQIMNVHECNSKNIFKIEVKDEIFHAATAEWNGKFHPSFTE